MLFVVHTQWDVPFQFIPLVQGHNVGLVNSQEIIFRKFPLEQVEFGTAEVLIIFCHDDGSFFLFVNANDLTKWYADDPAHADNSQRGPWCILHYLNLKVLHDS